MKGVFRPNLIEWDQICRMGIIPIVKKKNKVFMGFGLSSTSANLMAIGGYYSKSDKNLYRTATREFYEEVGTKISIDKINRSYVCVGNYSACVFASFNTFFDIKRVNEITNMIWMTFKQFHILYLYNDLSIGKNTKIFKFSESLSLVAKAVIKASLNGLFFLERSFRIQPRGSDMMPKSLDDFFKLPGFKLFAISCKIVGNNLQLVIGARKFVFNVNTNSIEKIAYKFIGQNCKFIISDRKELNNIFFRVMTKIFRNKSDYIVLSEGTKSNNPEKEVMLLLDKEKIETLKTLKVFPPARQNFMRMLSDYNLSKNDYIITNFPVESQLLKIIK